MINIFKKIKKIPNKLKKCCLNPETIFRNKHDSDQFVNLGEWQNIGPDFHISNYNNIVCDENFKKLSQVLHLEKKILLSVREMWNIYNWVIKTKDIPGDIAEVGVFRGGSAKLICEIKTKKLHLFDTFTGLPETDAIDKGLVEGSFAESLENVKKYLSNYKDVYFYPGIFPQSAEQLDENIAKFSFVHLDVDIYSGTINSLKYFYERVLPGGAILSHDYRCAHTPGVKKAFDEFFQDKPEKIIELWDTQALIIKQ